MGWPAPKRDDWHMLPWPGAFTELRAQWDAIDYRPGAVFARCVWDSETRTWCRVADPWQSLSTKWSEPQLDTSTQTEPTP